MMGCPIDRNEIQALINRSIQSERRRIIHNLQKIKIQQISDVELLLTAIITAISLEGHKK